MLTTNNPQGFMGQFSAKKAVEDAVEAIDFLLSNFYQEVDFLSPHALYRAKHELYYLRQRITGGTLGPLRFLGSDAEDNWRPCHLFYCLSENYHSVDSEEARAIRKILNLWDSNSVF